MRSFIISVGWENDKMSKAGEGERRDTLSALSSILPLKFMVLAPMEKVSPAVPSTSRDHRSVDPYSSL